MSKKNIFVTPVKTQVPEKGAAISIDQPLSPCRGEFRQGEKPHLGKELGIENISEEEVYAALDWLYERQGTIENSLAKMHLKDGVLLLDNILFS
jgi:hypothetical protein